MGIFSLQYGTVQCWPQNFFIERFRNKGLGTGFGAAFSMQTPFLIRKHACSGKLLEKRLMKINMEGKWLLPLNYLPCATTGNSFETIQETVGGKDVYPKLKGFVMWSFLVSEEKMKWKPFEYCWAFCPDSLQVIRMSYRCEEWLLRLDVFEYRLLSHQQY